MKKIVKSMKFRILAAIVSILLVSIGIETVVWMNNTARQTERTMVDSFDASLSVANQNFAAAMMEINRLSALAGSSVGEGKCVGNYLRVFREGSSASDVEKLYASRALEQFLISQFKFQYYVTGVSVSDLSSHQQTFGIVMKASELYEQPWWKAFMEGPEEVAWIVPHDGTPSRSAGGKRVFSIVRKIAAGTEVGGIELVDISCDILGEMYGVSENLVFITEDAEGERLVYARDGVEYPSEIQRIEIIQEIPVVGWIARGWIPRDAIRARTVPVLNRILALNALAGILLCLVIGLVISYTTKELSTLANAVKEVSMERMELPVVIRSDDEVGKLYQQINRMLRRIRELIAQIQASEDAKRGLEILALQEQINPHFLNNTLNTITYLAQLRGAKNIQYVSSALSDMLHLALSPEKFITVDRELAYLWQYLSIMEYKYSGKFIPEYEVDPVANSCLIPKLILQPLVENALKHGIATLSRPGYVHISASVEGERLRLAVRDNGNGIDPALLDKINRVPSENEVMTETSIGVFNVRNRICLIYGRQGRFHVSSEVDEYTLAEIEIPVSREGDETQ